MVTYSLSKSFDWHAPVTDKVAQLCAMFGLTIDRLSSRTVVHGCELEIDDGDIVYMTGPSGAGKSVLLGELERSIPATERTNLAQIELPGDATLIDCIDGDVLSGLRLLSVAGLNDCVCILNQPRYLSDGQKYRFRLAMALASTKRFIFADEFCSNLDRLTATVIAHKIHKFARHTGRTFILAGSHDDILFDLAPDVLVVKDFRGPAEVIYRRAGR
jgi:ABC-type ATPase with predicted acetyltransferase domain